MNVMVLLVEWTINDTPKYLVHVESFLLKYSNMPNKRTVSNNRTGCYILQKLISAQCLISAQALIKLKSLIR